MGKEGQWDTLPLVVPNNPLPSAFGPGAYHAPLTPRRLPNTLQVAELDGTPTPNRNYDEVKSRTEFNWISRRAWGGVLVSMPSLLPFFAWRL